MTGFEIVYDVTGAEYNNAPAGLKALYVTGSDGVPATAEQLAANPDAVLIDQTPASGAWDPKADVDDMENGAVGISEVAGRAKERLASFKAVARPGQREPAIYASAVNVTSVANELIKGGVTSGVGLWVADWDMTEAQSVADVVNGSGPFPIIGVQFRNSGAFDMSIFSTTWLNNRSKKGTTPVETQGFTIPGIPGEWKIGSPVLVSGLGPDGTVLWVATTTDGKKWLGPVKAT